MNKTLFFLSLLFGMYQLANERWIWAALGLALSGHFLLMVQLKPKEPGEPIS